MNWDEAFFGVVIIAAATNIEEYFLLFRSIQKNHPEIGLGALMGKIIWNLSMTFGISALVIRAQMLISPLLIINALILTGILIPSVIFLSLSRKELNWRGGIYFISVFLFFLIGNLLFTK